MTCSKAQSLITSFINDKLELGELEEFISHVHTCEECREELEVYYALLTAMKQLDEDQNLSDDFSLELSEKLEREQEKIVRAKFLYYRKRGVMIVIILLLTTFFSLQHYFTQKEEKVNMITDSNFQLRISFREKYYEGLKQELNWRLEELKQEPEAGITAIPFPKNEPQSQDGQ